jgi:TonB family protein
MRRFYIRSCVRHAVVLLVCVPLPIWSQTDRLQKDLNSAYTGKTLLLRNFYSGDDLTYDQGGHLQSTSRQGPWTLAGVEINRIVVTPHDIEIGGNRMGTLYKDGKTSFVQLGKIRIHVAGSISDSDTEAVIHPIFNQIFVGPGEDLRSLLPDYWRPYFEGNSRQSRLAAWQANREENAAPIAASKLSSGIVSAPRAIYSPDPKYTREAKSKHIEGTSRLIVVVNPSGSAENIAIMDPLGMGLDDEAVTAVRQWRFKPAMRSGQPVQVQINVGMDFRCCP